jgi:hypothetical protein
MNTREPAASEGFVHVPEVVNVWTLIAPPDVGVDDTHAVPLLVKTLPEVLGATAMTFTPATVALVAMVSVGVVMPVEPLRMMLMVWPPTPLAWRQH